MRVLITGAAGYLGSALAAHLSSRHELLRHTRSLAPDLLAGGGAESLIGDLREPATIASLLRAEPQALIHTVSLDHHQSEVDTFATYATNVAPLAELLRRAPESLRLVVYLSTIHVYGPDLVATVAETRLPCPANLYGLTHWQCEQLGELAARRTSRQIVNLRLANIFGPPGVPQKKCWSLCVNDLCRQAWRDRRVRLASDGSPLRDFVPIGRLLATVEALLQPAPDLPRLLTCHIASGQTRSIRETAETVAALAAERLGAPVSVDCPPLAAPPLPREDRWHFDLATWRRLGVPEDDDFATAVRANFDHLAAHP